MALQNDCKRKHDEDFEKFSQLEALRLNFFGICRSYEMRDHFFAFFIRKKKKKKEIIFFFHTQIFFFNFLDKPIFLLYF
jgi:hypothetical protein